MTMENKEIVEYEEVRGRHPISGEIQTIKIEKPVMLTPEEVVQRVKDELKKNGLEPVYEVKVKDPVTGKDRVVTLSRMGHTEENLLLTLADPDLSRDRKDFAISMYLYERGAHNTSMMVDLMRYKGQHTKETRVFKSQIRFDFESFVSTFTNHLDEQARLLGLTLGIDLSNERSLFAQWLSLENNRGKGYGYIDFFAMTKRTNVDNYEMSREDRTEAALIEMALNSQEEANMLKKRVKQMTDARERDKGKGVYVDTMGRPYTLDDPELNDAIKADREATAEANKDD